MLALLLATVLSAQTYFYSQGAVDYCQATPEAALCAERVVRPTTTEALGVGRFRAIQRLAGQIARSGIQPETGDVWRDVRLNEEGDCEDRALYAYAEIARRWPDLEPALRPVMLIYDTGYVHLVLVIETEQESIVLDPASADLATIRQYERRNVMVTPQGSIAGRWTPYTAEQSAGLRPPR